MYTHVYTCIYIYIYMYIHGRGGGGGGRRRVGELSGAPQAATNSGRSCSYLPRYT